MMTEETHRLAVGGSRCFRRSLRLLLMTGCMAVMPEAAGAGTTGRRASAPVASMQSTSAWNSRPAYRSTYGQAYTGSFLPQAGGSVSAGATPTVRLRTSAATVRSYGSTGAAAQGFTRTTAAQARTSCSAVTSAGIAVGPTAVAPAAVASVAADDTDLAFDDGFTKTMRRQAKPEGAGSYPGEVRDGWTWNGTEWVGGPSEVDMPLGDGLWLLLLLAGLLAGRKTVRNNLGQCCRQRV